MVKRYITDENQRMRYSIGDMASRVMDNIKQLWENDFCDFIDYEHDPIEIFGERYYASGILRELDADKYYEEWDKWFDRNREFELSDIIEELESMEVGETRKEFCGERIEFGVTRSK